MTRVDRREGRGGRESHKPLLTPRGRVLEAERAALSDEVGVAFPATLPGPVGAGLPGEEVLFVFVGAVTGLRDSVGGVVLGLPVVVAFLRN